MRARLGLQAAGQTVERREISLKNKPLEMLQASAQGMVPVMVLANGTVLEGPSCPSYASSRIPIPGGLRPRHGASWRNGYKTLKPQRHLRG